MTHIEMIRDMVYDIARVAMLAIIAISCFVGGAVARDYYVLNYANPAVSIADYRAGLDACQQQLAQAQNSKAPRQASRGTRR